MHIRKRGFTLYELVVTMGLVAILFTLGIPSFAASLARQRQHVEIDALFHAVHLARKESIMRRKVVTLCPSLDGKTCSPDKDWSRGWLMFENKDRDSPPRIDSDEPVLTRHVVVEGVTIHANRRTFTLRATFLRATNGTFVVCDVSNRIAPKALVISYTGRPRVARRRTNGDAYSCTD
jgi:type IV fimbrial biogenesis protein FimT